MEDLREFNLIVAGVGGQGSVLASHIIAEAAVSAGLRVRVGETFGAAQRGGKVHSHVRMGEDVYGPLCPRASLDVLVGLEPNEALRLAVDYSTQDTVIITNTRPVPSMDSNIGADSYAEVGEIVEGLRRLSKEVVPIDATGLAVEAGNERTMNVVILGTLCATELLPYEPDALRRAVSERVPPRTVEVNMRAFEMGYERCREILSR